MITWIILILYILTSAGLVAAGIRAQCARERKKYLGATLVFVGCVMAFHLIPLLGFPWPLLSAKGGTHGWHNILPIWIAVLIDLVQWTLVTIAFARLVHRVQAALLVPLSVAAIALVTACVVIGVRLVGMNFYWELWR